MDSKSTTKYTSIPSDVRYHSDEIENNNSNIRRSGGVRRNIESKRTENLYYDNHRNNRRDNLEMEIPRINRNKSFEIYSGSSEYSEEKESNIGNSRHKKTPTSCKNSPSSQKLYYSLKKNNSYVRSPKKPYRSEDRIYSSVKKYRDDYSETETSPKERYDFSEIRPDIKVKPQKYEPVKIDFKNGRPDYSSMSDRQKYDARQLLEARFHILMTEFPDEKIEIPTRNICLDNIHTQYETLVKRLIVKQSVGGYRTYLIVGYIILEYIGCVTLGMNDVFSGFTMKQIKYLNKYDSLLTKLGEKYYTIEESQWPIEMILIGSIVMNGIVFAVVNYLVKKVTDSTDMANYIHDVIEASISGSGTGIKNVDEMGLPDLPTGSSDAPNFMEMFGNIASNLGGTDGLQGLMGNILGGIGGNKSKVDISNRDVDY